MSDESSVKTQSDAGLVFSIVPKGLIRVVMKEPCEVQYTRSVRKSHVHCGIRADRFDEIIAVNARKDLSRSSMTNLTLVKGFVTLANECQCRQTGQFHTKDARLPSPEQMSSRHCPPKGVGYGNACRSLE
jgi:hypothetical protein